MQQTEQPQPPGEFIKTALAERGWTQADLAIIVGRHVPAINEIIQGKRQLTPEIAVELAVAFSGTTAKEWMDRETAYRLSMLSGLDPEVQRRARLYEMAPVKEMEKRGWIKPLSRVEDLEHELCQFFNVTSLEEEPRIVASARQTFKADELTTVQRAWVFRAAQLAAVLNVRPFVKEKFDSGLTELRKLADAANKAHHVPRVLAEMGIRLVVVEPLPKSHIDGAAFWLDEQNPSPVIVLSLRYDRIDAFWHTLAHELIHIRYEDKQSVDSDLFGESRVSFTSEMEARADRIGSEFLVPSDKLQLFIIRVRPFYSKIKISQFAKRMGVHPGIVNGQLQHLREIPWSANREMHEKIRGLVTATAITDGYGKMVAMK
jgi:HTH-type transcriptional regulator/antitoxin HigA